MSESMKGEIAEILRAGNDLTIATLRADGAPQATTVSYVSDGLDIFFGCAADSPKAQNLARDPRVSLTVNLPYEDWGQIRGVSLFGRARRITDVDELARVGALFVAKFPQIGDALPSDPNVMALFCITPEVVSVLDYRKGFGHTELVTL
ncbi:pyridoxamine 5'-phosphate oxidase family protein [Phenylobacterium soli]|uniref:Pyridoxamine 5'-phosphate oxidase n=1 Tax=Phenylobacterium soli TaxID=2170551 RepID=A0A328AHK5_9CAUL|nr:pyridoxamine 5'-phosphate oxidase family protein [Phenylobacterium soli]RAK54393.1 pyridoxamine 5'-phosphate oxidase [Phenylobacterium soli]